MRQSKNLYTAALMAALAGVAEADAPRNRAGKQPRKFTDARIAAAEAKRQRKAEKRLTQQRRQQGGRSDD